LNLAPRSTHGHALAFLLALLAPLASSAANDADERRSIVDGVIRPLMARYDIPGMAVALTVDGSPSVYNYGVSS
jgi:beta-lactamase class C